MSSVPPVICVSFSHPHFLGLEIPWPQVSASTPRIPLHYCEGRLNMPLHLPASHSQQQVTLSNSINVLVCAWRIAGESFSLWVIGCHFSAPCFVFLVCDWIGIQIRLKWLSSELQVWRPLVFPGDRCDREESSAIVQYPPEISVMRFKWMIQKHHDQRSPWKWLCPYMKC